MIVGKLYSTRQVAGMLGVSVNALSRACWEGRVSPPGKSPSGAFLWARNDIERASWAMLHRSIEEACSTGKGAAHVE